MTNMVFPGEAEAIAQTVAWGAEYGYGNLIDHLRQAWKRMLMEKWGFDEVSAEIGAGIRPPTGLSTPTSSGRL
jgi:uncharacterized protein (UPF0548 family)